MTVGAAEPDSTAAHIEAVLDLLEQDVPATVTVYDGAIGDRPETPPVTPYLMVLANAGPDEALTLDDVPMLRSFAVRVHAVGQTAREARAAADFARRALLHRRPTITGRQCWAITHTASDPVRRDDDVRPPVLVQVDLYELSSIPGSA